MAKDTIENLTLRTKENKLAMEIERERPRAKTNALKKLRGKDNTAKPAAGKGRKKVSSDQFAYWGMTKIDKDLATKAKIACLNLDITQVEFAQQAFTHYLKHLKQS